VSLRYLIALILVGLILLFLYRKLRPYLAVVRRLLGLVQDVRRMGETFDRPQEQAERNERLVRCAACHTWVPAARAVTPPSSKSSYCSHACLESMAAAPRRKTRGRNV
jgi:hypothetical protein